MDDFAGQLRLEPVVAGENVVESHRRNRGGDAAITIFLFHFVVQLGEHAEHRPLVDILCYRRKGLDGLALDVGVGIVQKSKENGDEFFDMAGPDFHFWVVEVFAQVLQCHEPEVGVDIEGLVGENRQEVWHGRSVRSEWRVRTEIENGRSKCEVVRRLTSGGNRESEIGRARKKWGV